MYAIIYWSVNKWISSSWVQRESYISFHQFLIRNQRKVEGVYFMPVGAKDTSVRLTPTETQKQAFIKERDYERGNRE
jgi:hypothetical protein